MIFAIVCTRWIFSAGIGSCIFLLNIHDMQAGVFKITGLLSLHSLLLYSEMEHRCDCDHNLTMNTIPQEMSQTLNDREDDFVEGRNVSVVMERGWREVQRPSLEPSLCKGQEEEPAKTEKEHVTMLQNLWEDKIQERLDQ